MIRQLSNGPGPSVLVTRNIGEEPVRRLADSCNVTLWDSENGPIPRHLLLQLAPVHEGILCLLTEQIDAELLERASRLRVIASMSVGVDHIDGPEANRRSILIANTPDVLTEATADLAWALILAASRRLPEMQTVVRRGEWTSWSPRFGVGQDVARRALGIVGAGRVGTAVLRRASGFSMSLAYFSRSRSDGAEALGARRAARLHELLRQCDIIVVTLPLSAGTSGMFGADEFAAMKSGSLFVNVSRGGIVDEDALAAGLRRRRPWAAGLDVFAHEPLDSSSPLLQLEHCVCLPHIGSATVSARCAMADLAVDNILSAFRTGRLLTPATLP
jgi:glyoxylate reductase